MFNRCLKVFLLALGLLPARAAAQDPVTITGRVTGDAGEPLRSANVSIPSLNLVTFTAPDGTYRLVVPGTRAQSAQVALNARIIGHRAQSVTVTLTPGTSIAQNFQLTPDPFRLEEIVVTGAGTEARGERLGTAIVNVSAAEMLRANETNLVQALAGKVPNVVTNQQSGDAGASTAIQIRGPKSFGGSQPLIVVDGVPINNTTRTTSGSPLVGAVASNRAADLNPDDIESVEILKGAAATSIYGASAGSAGAILITTKRGRAGRTTYSLRSTYQSNKPVQVIPLQRTYGVGSNGVSSNCTAVNCAISSSFFSFGPALASGTATYDHATEMYETGTSIDNTLSMSGGNERTTFYLSGGGLIDNGFMTGKNDYWKRYSMRFNGSHGLLDNLNVRVTGSYVQTKGRGHQRGNALGGLLGALRTPPEFNNQEYLHPVTGLHRSWRFPNPGPTAFTSNRGFDNPFYFVNEAVSTSETGRYFGNVHASYQPLSWLAVNYTLGADYTADDRTEGFPISSSGGAAGGLLTRWQFYDRILDHTLLATGSFNLTSNIQSSVSIGQNLNETYFRQINVTGRTWIAPKPFKLSNTVARETPTDSEQRTRIEGYFLQGTMDLLDQFFLQARVRNDGNSRFGVKSQRAWYPGGSIAWSFTKSARLPETLVSYGKLRVAYGETGQQPPIYQTQDIFTAATLNDYNPGSILEPTQGGIGGLYASTIKGNPSIKPERVKEIEAGLDLSLFRGRADVSVTRYDARSQDVVFFVGTPPSTGFTTVVQNAAKLTNKGWELSGNLRPVQGRSVSIEIGANWARNRNLVTDLGAIQPQLDGKIPMPTPENCGSTAAFPRCVIGFSSSFAGQSTHAQIGFPLGVWRGVDYARCGRGLGVVAGNDVGAACAGQPDGALYIAASGYPITDPNTRVVGDPQPDWTGGLSLNVNVRGVKVSAFVDHRHGGDVLNMTRSSLYNYGTHKDTEVRGQPRTFGKDWVCQNKTCDLFNGPVVGPGANTAVPVSETWFVGSGGIAGPVTNRVEDGTNTRLREVSLSYAFTGAWVRRLGGMREVEVKVSGRNLKLWTNYSGFDPETNLGGADAANRGIDWFNNPLSRSVVVSVTLNH
ncbi:MAG: SusC/RagA family TonB-linked outer membrane protein [Gemmatimonadetes bacterium]|nr:SusC/RagA family TonB-linked outer membrane protein [Gemmatimonadota bacterium]